MPSPSTVALALLLGVPAMTAPCDSSAHRAFDFWSGAMTTTFDGQYTRMKGSAP